jgi:DNA polymerase elongation subunit (family B)
LKYRGIEARRSDQAPFVRQFQLRLIERLASARTLAECRAMREELAGMVHDAEQRLRGREVPIAELILRRKTSMAADEYRGNSMTAVAARQAKRAGIDLHAGEAVCFLVTRSGDRDPDARLRVSCLLQPEDAGDVDFYIDHLRRAAATVLEPLLGEPLARILGIEEIPPPRNPVRTEQLTLFDAWAVG